MAPEFPAPFSAATRGLIARHRNPGQHGRAWPPVTGGQFGGVDWWAYYFDEAPVRPIEGLVGRQVTYHAPVTSDKDGGVPCVGQASPARYAFWGLLSLPNWVCNVSGSNVVARGPHGGATMRDSG